MARTVNLLSPDDSLSALNASGVLRDVSEVNHGWTLSGGSAALVATQANRVSPNYFSLRITPDNEVTPVQINMPFINVDLGQIPDTEVIFHCLVNCERPLLAVGKLTEYTNAFGDEDGVRSRTEDGRFSSIRTNHVPFDAGQTNKNLKIRVQFTEHQGNPIFFTIPVLMDDDAYLRSMAVQNMRKQLPTFYWDIDSQETNPDNPFFKLIDILSYATDDVAQSYIEMFDYELNELSILNDGTEDWARSTLTDPKYVDEDKRLWLAQFTGGDLKSNVSYKSFTYNTNEFVNDDPNVSPFDDQYWLTEFYGTRNTDVSTTYTGSDNYYALQHQYWSKLNGTYNWGNLRQNMDYLSCPYMLREMDDDAGSLHLAWEFNLMSADYNVNPSDPYPRVNLNLRDPLSGGYYDIPAIAAAGSYNFQTVHRLRQTDDPTEWFYSDKDPSFQALARFLGKYIVIDPCGFDSTFWRPYRIGYMTNHDFNPDNKTATTSLQEYQSFLSPTTNQFMTEPVTVDMSRDMHHAIFASPYRDNEVYIAKYYVQAAHSTVSGSNAYITQTIPNTFGTSHFGSRICISGSGNACAASDEDHNIYVYKEVVNSMVQLGNVLNGELDVVDMKMNFDGSNLFVLYHAGDYMVVRVYEYSTANNDWNVIHEMRVDGSPLYLDALDEFVPRYRPYGRLVVSDDGNTIAVANPVASLIDNNANFTSDNHDGNHGFVRVYKKRDNQYLQVGEDIYRAVLQDPSTLPDGQSVVFGTCIDLDSKGDTLVVNYGCLYDLMQPGLMRPLSESTERTEWRESGPPAADVYDLNQSGWTLRETLSSQIDSTYYVGTSPIERPTIVFPQSVTLSDNGEIVSILHSQSFSPANSVFETSFTWDRDLKRYTRTFQGTNSLHTTPEISYKTLQDHVFRERPMHRISQYAMSPKYADLFSKDGFDWSLTYDYTNPYNTPSPRVLIGFSKYDNGYYLTRNNAFETFLKTNAGTIGNKFYVEQGDTVWEIGYSGQWWFSDQIGSQGPDPTNEGYYWVSYEYIEKVVGSGDRTPRKNEFEAVNFTGFPHNTLGCKLHLVDSENDETVFIGNGDFIEWQLANSYYGRSAGSRNSMVQAVQQVLIGSRIVAVSPNYEDQFHRIHIRTLTSETPTVDPVTTSSGAVLTAVEPTRPAGFIFTHETVDKLFITLNNIGIGRLDLFELG